MGALVPPWYKEKATTEVDIIIAAFFFGASMTMAAFDFCKAVRQTYKCWRRNHRTNAYVVMVWLVLTTCIVTSITIWLFLRGKIPPSIYYFVGMLLLWVTQVQCLTQILANRLSLILYDPVRARRIKVGLAVAIGVINVTVFCIWVPARLQISQTYIRANVIWDRAEKCIFVCIDAILNAYFMWLVKSKLVANGLTQYNLVYKFNLVMVCISISLDILIIGLMSLPDDAVYVQVHPFTYLVKLNIEMNMAELLGKVVKRSSQKKPSFPTSDIYQTQLGPDAFDRGWLGSAQNIIMPNGGGQAHELNTNILNGAAASGPDGASSSAGQQEAERRRLHAGSVGEDHRKDNGRSAAEV